MSESCYIDYLLPINLFSFITTIPSTVTIAITALLYIVDGQIFIVYSNQNCETKIVNSWMPSFLLISGWGLVINEQED